LRSTNMPSKDRLLSCMLQPLQTASFRELVMLRMEERAAG